MIYDRCFIERVTLVLHVTPATIDCLVVCLFAANGVCCATKVFRSGIFMAMQLPKFTEILTGNNDKDYYCSNNSAPVHSNRALFEMTLICHFGWSTKSRRPSLTFHSFRNRIAKTWCNEWNDNFQLSALSNQTETNGLHKQNCWVL